MPGGGDPHEHWLPHQFRVTAACSKQNTAIVLDVEPGAALDAGYLAIAAEVFTSHADPPTVTSNNSNSTGASSNLYVAPTPALASAASKVFATKEGLKVTWLRFREDGDPYRKRVHGVVGSGQAHEVLVTTVEAFAMAQERAPSLYAFGTFGVVCLDEAVHHRLDGGGWCSMFARDLLRSCATPRVIYIIDTSCGPRHERMMRALRITQVGHIESLCTV